MNSHNSMNGTTPGTATPGANLTTMATIAGVDTMAAPPAAVNPPPAVMVTPDPGQEHRAVGVLSADALARSIDATADDVLSAGRSVVDVAADIMREATELADGIKRCGAAFAEHVTQFADLAQQVTDTMRSTRSRVLGTPGAEVAPAAPARPQRGA